MDILLVIAGLGALLVGGDLFGAWRDRAGEGLWHFSHGDRLTIVDIGTSMLEHATVALIVFARIGWRITRREGALLATAYLAYLARLAL